MYYVCTSFVYELLDCEGCIHFWHVIHSYHTHVQALQISYISITCVETLYTQRTMCNSLKNYVHFLFRLYVWVRGIEACGGNGYIVLACIMCVLDLYHDYLFVGVGSNFGT